MSKQAKFVCTAGPVEVPGNIWKVISQPVIHQRTPAFEAFLMQFKELLKKLFITEKASILAMPGSGTTGVAIAMQNLFSRGEKVCIPVFGKFSERWEAYAEKMELQPIVIRKKWGEGINPEEILATVKNHSCSGLFLTHCETSTGVELDVESIAYAVKRQFPDILVVVDGMSTIGAVPYYHDAWEIDVSIVAAQKALWNPAGTVYLALSDVALDRLESSKAVGPFSISQYLQEKYPFTPPTALFFGVAERLKALVVDKGLPANWNEVHQWSRQFKAEMKELGASFPSGMQSDALTAFSFPGIDVEACRRQLLEKFQIEITGGQGLWKGNWLRVGHFGLATKENKALLVASIRKLVQ